MDEPAAPPATARVGPHTKRFLAAFYALAAVWGYRNLWPDDHSRLDFPFALLFAVSLGWWAVVDALRRGHPIPMLAKPWFYLFAGLLVPLYVVWSRGWRGIGWVLFHAFFWYVAATVSMYASYFLLTTFASSTGEPRP